MLGTISSVKSKQAIQGVCKREKMIKGGRVVPFMEAVRRGGTIWDLARLNYTGNFTPVLAFLSLVHLVRLQEGQFPVAVSCQGHGDACHGRYSLVRFGKPLTFYIREPHRWGPTQAPRAQLSPWAIRQLPEREMAADGATAHFYRLSFHN